MPAVSLISLLLREAGNAGMPMVRRYQGKMTMAAPQTRSRQPRQMDAGAPGAGIGSFRLHLAAEGKVPKTIRLYTEAVVSSQLTVLCWKRGMCRSRVRRPATGAEHSRR